MVVSAYLLYYLAIFKGLNSLFFGMLFASNEYSPKKFMCAQFKGEICLSNSSSKSSWVLQYSIAFSRYLVFHTQMVLIRIFRALAR
jgi:hypothetical protein